MQQVQAGIVIEYAGSSVRAKGPIKARGTVGVGYIGQLEQRGGSCQTVIGCPCHAGAKDPEGCCRAADSGG